MAATVLRQLPGVAKFQGRTLTNTAQRQYIVQVDLNVDGTAPDDGEMQAITASGLPSLYDAYSVSFPYLRAIDADATPYEWPRSKNLFLVTVDYGTVAVVDSMGNSGLAVGATSTSGASQGSNPGGGGASVSPESRGMRIEILNRATEKSVGRKTVYDEDVVNKAGTPITGLVVPRTLLCYRLTGYVTENILDAADRAARFLDTVNDDTFWGKPARSFLCTSYIPAPEYIFGGWYTKITVELDLNPELWNPSKVPNVGLLQRVGSVLEPCVDSTGTAVQSEVPLSVTGAQLTTGAINFLEFNFFTEEDWSELFVG